MILVCGGTGLLGSRVANGLVADGQQVRVLSRGLTTARVPLDPAVELVIGDVRQPESLAPALEDVDVVVLAVQGFAGPGGGSPRTVDLDGGLAVVAAAERQGADVVMLSVANASATSPLEIARMKYAVEERLRAGTVPWTIVRADAFAQTWIGVLVETAGSSRRPLVFGDADNPISWVDVDEVAALVRRAVLDPSLRGRVLDICGPEALTLEQLARLVMATRGWPGEPRRIPRLGLRVMALATALVRPDLARQARASLAMDRLPAADDHRTREEVPGLPATPVSQVVSAARAGPDQSG
ncbi:MAG: SDR family oxidoreductase [Nocardioides sp.]